MTTPRFTLLPDRGVVGVTGPDAAKLLQGLVTNDLDVLERQRAIHAALLTPQGKILFDFHVVRWGEGYLLETGAGGVADLVKRLGFYKLRAKAEIADVTADYALAASWAGDLPDVPGVVSYPDSRAEGLGERVLVPVTDLETARARWREAGAVESSLDVYHAHRLELGVPEAGRDYALGDAFPHEAGFDRFHGVDFDKGCFVGQEVVARMQHKTVVRKRVVPVTAAADLPGTQPDIAAGEAVIGRLGSVAGRRGLALLRIDRALEAYDKGQPLQAGGVQIAVDAEALEAYRSALAARAAT